MPGTDDRWSVTGRSLQVPGTFGSDFQSKRPMKRMTGLSFAIVVLLLAGCVPVQPAPTSLILADGARVQQLNPGDTAHAPIVERLAALVAGLDTPLYAYYPPERVTAEILARPHLEAVYSPPVTLQGKGYAAETARLIVVVTAEGPLVLTQAREGADWTASEASDRDLFTSLFRVIREQVGVDLEAAGR